MKKAIFIASTLCVGLLLISIKFCSGMRTMKEKQLIDQVGTIQGVVDLFALPAAMILQKTDDYIKGAQEQIDHIIAVPVAERTFENTALALDRIVGLSNAVISEHIYEGLELLSPEEAVRNASHQAVIKLRDFFVDQIMNNKKLYQAFKAYVEGNAHNESLNSEQRYFFTETMKDFERAGLNLPDEKLAQVKKLQKKLTELALMFGRNIAQDNCTITVSRSALAGLDDDFIASLKRTDDGLYILGVDYPTYFNVMEHCLVEDTRQQLYNAFNNRAYPENDVILKDIIAKRDELARLLGFASYAQLDIDSEMAKTPERAEEFILDLIDKSKNKVKEEVKELTATLPESVELTADGKIKPWDFAYLKAMYKKGKFDLDERKIAEYFPMKKTVTELL
ncbi:MAG: M3 family metallopeptidase, partial [Candidatus Babeliales bacterium]